MKFETAQNKINKLGAVNNVLTVGNKRLTITEKRGELDNIMIEFLDTENPFNSGTKPNKYHYFRTLSIALEYMN